MFKNKILLLFVFINYNCKANKPELTNRVVGGYPIDIIDSPWTVFLTISVHSEKVTFNCNGIIISSTFILTAAHCTMDHRKSEGLHYAIGAGTNHPHTNPSFIVQRVIEHSMYIDGRNDYDIALILMQDKFIFSDRLKPIALETKIVQLAGKMASATGYGKTDQYSPFFPKILRKVNVPIVDLDVCRKQYVGLFLVTNRVICAGYLDRNGYDSCLGDSGGPLVVDNKLVGIVSSGMECGDSRYPGIYTRVSAYTDWIKKHLRENEEKENIDYISNAENEWNIDYEDSEYIDWLMDIFEMFK